MKNYKNTENAIKMAPSKRSQTLEEQSSPSEVSDIEELELDTPVSKRRRLSVSSDDSYVAPIPLPTLSRIKQNSNQKPENDVATAVPVMSKDALDLGLQDTDSGFALLNVNPWLVNSLSAMAIRRPTAIQRACIPEILKGSDCIGGSRTGSGKTLAFAVPILQKWAQDPFGIFAVVLTPTR